MKRAKEFLPEKPINGKIGFYPAMTTEEWRSLPLPMKCATWSAFVKYVIFDTFFSEYGFSGKVEVHAENAFKALFRCVEGDTQLYSVCAVRLFNGKTVAAKWWQDSETGAFQITDLKGNALGTQGGFRGHIPANCKKNSAGEWALFPTERKGGELIRTAF